MRLGWCSALLVTCAFSWMKCGTMEMALARDWWVVPTRICTPFGIPLKALEAARSCTDYSSVSKHVVRFSASQPLSLITLAAEAPR